MIKKIIMDPITRLSGPLGIEVEIEKDMITDAKCSGLQYRGFEEMLIGRPPLDAIYFTERICGICSAAHGLVSTLALEDALKIVPDENGARIRNFALGADFLQNNIRQLCLFSFPDYAKIRDIPGNSGNDFRLPQRLNDKINKDYIRGIDYSRLAHEMEALIGGKAPHNHGIFVGGTTVNLDASKIIRLKSILQSIYEFISNNVIEDLYIISKYYPEYYKIGAGTRNLLTFGLFDDLNIPDLEYVKPSSYINGKKGGLNVNAITESTSHSWYSPDETHTAPSAAPSHTDIKKPDAYTFIKAPRYYKNVVQVGSLARMILSGSYKYSISTMDRLMARALESKKLSEMMLRLLEVIEPVPAVQKQYEIPQSASGVGLKDAVRGTLGHWISIENKVIKNYDIITPSAWNLSPEDENRQHGALEAALIGTKLQNPADPVEIGRIIRSFDPCISCATHVTKIV